VEQPVAQDLLQVGLDREAREALAVEAHRVDRLAVVDLRARRVLEHEHLGAAVLPEHARHLDPVDVLEVVAELVGVLALQRVVDLHKRWGGGARPCW
jgi:hypothetical protein